MEKQAKEVVVKTCPYCGEKIENPNINYCPKCRNVLWSESLREKTGRIR